jgi:hypothetical protein
MLGDMLGAHSQCLCVPESQFVEHLLARRDFDPESLDPRVTLTRISTDLRFRLLWRLPVDPAAVEPSELGTTYARVIGWLVRAYGRQHGKPASPVWVDHTPTNFKRRRTMLRMFPDARFIHLVRDGRAVAASLIPLDWGPNNAMHAAEFWMARCADGLAAELELGTERVLRVRYEDVLESPEQVLGQISRFAGLEYELAMVSGSGQQPSRYHERQHRLVGQAPDRSRAQSWRQVLSSREVEIFEAEAGELLETFGYRAEYSLRARPASRREVLTMRVTDLARRGWNNLHRLWRARRSLH